MSDFVAGQIRAALRTLPWYILVPVVPVASVWAFFILIGWSSPKDLFDFCRIAGSVGLLVWFVRQSIRFLIALRIVTR